MTSKAKREARSMFAWVIRKLFENDNTRILTLNQLKRCLTEAWDDLWEEGYIGTPEDTANNKR